MIPAIQHTDCETRPAVLCHEAHQSQIQATKAPTAPENAPTGTNQNHVSLENYSAVPLHDPNSDTKWEE